MEYYKKEILGYDVNFMYIDGKLGFIFDYKGNKHGNSVTIKRRSDYETSEAFQEDYGHYKIAIEVCAKETIEALNNLV